METRQAEVIRLDVPASAQYLRIIGECIVELMNHVAELPDHAELVYASQLAAHEVCTNIVAHAYDEGYRGRILVTLTLVFQKKQLIMDFYDTGVSFDINTVAPPRLDEAQVHGYGLFIIHSLMDSVVYSPQADGNYWQLVKQLAPANQHSA